MTQLLGRKVRVLVARPVGFSKFDGNNAVSIEDLRVEFKVTKTLDKTPNTSEVTITNLNENHRRGFERKGLKFLLEAGYESGVQRIFIGDIRFAKSVRQGADWRTTLQSGDGERAYRFADLAKSFKGGTKKSDVLTELVSAMGLGSGNLEDAKKNVTGEFVNGFVANGDVQGSLTKVLDSVGQGWSIQDGQLQILQRKGFVGNTILLNENSGLIGTPSFGAPKEKGDRPLLTARTLLRGNIRPGRVVSIRSEQINGPFRVIKVTHEGDTSGGPWYTTIEAQTA